MFFLFTIFLFAIFKFTLFPFVLFSFIFFIFALSSFVLLLFLLVLFSAIVLFLMRPPLPLFAESQVTKVLVIPNFESFNIVSKQMMLRFFTRQFLEGFNDRCSCAPIHFYREFFKNFRDKMLGSVCSRFLDIFIPITNRVFGFRLSL